VKVSETYTDLVLSIFRDSVVDAAARHKKMKRSLSDHKGNHKRWLEEEWEGDSHHGELTADELHKRWFGSDVVAWIRKLLSTGVSPSHTHNFEQTFTAILVKEEFECTFGAVDVSANLLAQAQARVEVSTTFGLTVGSKSVHSSFRDKC
jgi:chitinase